MPLTSCPAHSEEPGSVDDLFSFFIENWVCKINLPPDEMWRTKLEGIDEVYDNFREDVKSAEKMFGHLPEYWELRSIIDTRPQDIYSGARTAVRQIHRQGAKVGMRMRAVFKTYNIVDLRITAVYNQRLGEMNDDDAQKEGYESLDLFKEAWNQRHPVRGWSPEQSIWVIEWKKPGN